MYRIGIECESIEDKAWGVGRIVSKLLQEIDRRPELKKEFKFFLYFKSQIPDYPYLANDIFVKKIIKPPFLPVSFSLYYYLWLPIKLWFEKLDLMYFPGYMLPVIFRGRSLVTLTEDLYYEATKGSLPFRYKLAYKIFSVWWAAKHATCIASVSEASKNEVARLFKVNPDGVFAIPNGVEINRNTTPSDWVDSMGNYILYVGQAFPRRHLKETILAFEKLKYEFKDLKLVAIGKDNYNPLIVKDLVDHLNKKMGGDEIIHRDYVDQSELEALYKNAKVVVYVSSTEAFGLPPLEGLGYGSVSVVADMPATREIFGDKTFFVKNPNSVDEIASVIRESLTNGMKRAEIKKSAEEILSRYTWQKHTDRFLEVVRSIMENEK